ncbi:Condensation domain-containing protein, partial [Izhakiella capsodis]
PLVTLSQQEIDTVVASVCGGAANVQDIYPLSPLQEGILFHHLLQERGDTYLLHSLMAFDSEDHLNAFIQALRLVIDRHDILRTAVCSQGLSRPVQVVWRSATLQVNTIEPAGTGDALACLRDCINPRQRRISLARAPLFSADTLYDPDRRQWLLGLCFHHMVCDHITMALICDEITRILQGSAAALPPPLPYRDFIAQLLRTPAPVHEAYFRSRLAGTDTPTAPFGILDVQESGGRTAELSRTLDASLTGRIQARARALGVSPGVLFHTAFARMLAQLCGHDDVVFGTVLMGRLQAGSSAEGGLGMFINTLPLRLSLAGMTVREAVLTTGRELAALFEHEQAPLALALRCSGVAAPLPLFSTLLNYRHSLPGGGTDGWHGMHLLETEERTNYPLTLSVDDTGNDFVLTAQAVSGIAPDRILRYLVTAVEGLVGTPGNEPEGPLAGISVLPPDERRQLLETFNATRRDFPRDSLVHTLFEEQVRRTPQALAVLS